VNSLLYLFACLSAVGLFLSILVHVASFFGLPVGSSTWGLHMGIFVVWLPAVLVSISLTKEAKQSEFWKAAMRGCPPWMRKMTMGFFIYALVNFAVFFFATVSSGVSRPSEGTTPTILKGFSGHWMAFYSAAMAILYSGSKLLGSGQVVRKCLNGHPASPFVEFCSTCGSAVPKA